MIEYKLKQLSENERYWLFDAIIKVVISDKEVAKEEMDDLIHALGIRGLDIDEKLINRMLKNSTDTIELRPFDEIDYNSAFIILTEVVKASAVDGSIPNCEWNLIKKIMQYLKFEKKAAEDIILWAEKLAECNSVEKELYNKIQKYHDM